MQQVQLTISIVLFNSQVEDVKRTIDSVMKTRLTFVIYLIINAPEDRFTDLVAFYNDDRIKVIFSPHNPGFGAGHNLAIQRTKESDYFLVLNPDVSFEEGVLEALYDYMETHPEVGNIMPKIVYPDGSLQRLCKLLPTPLNVWSRRFFPKSNWAQKLNDRYELKEFEYDRIMPIPNLSGCFMFLRNSVLQKTGGFDERFFLYLEDIDLNRRIWQHAIFGTLAAKAVGVKYVAAMLEGLGFYFTEQPDGIPWKTKVLKRIQILLYKISLPRADRIIFLNHDDPIDLLKKNKIRVKDFKVLEGIGLSMDEFKFVPPMTSNSVRFIFVGRLLKEKGIFEFLEAAGLVKDKYEGAQFYVLGATDNENPGAIKEQKLKEYIDRGIIDYPGQVKNINEWLTKSHVFVLPSYREGLPRSTQEAMAVGRAVITTDVPGCRETVVNNRNGFIVSKGSTIELADKMSYFIEHPDEITRMGLESYVIAKEKYNVDFINEKLLNWLQN